MKIQKEFQLDWKNYILATYYMAYARPVIYIPMTLLAIFAAFNLRIWIYQILLFGIVVLIPTMIYLIAKRAYQLNPVVREKQTLELNERGIFIKGKSFEMERTWEDMEKISNSQKFLFIWLTPKLTYPVPVKLFSIDEIKMLHQTLGEKRGIKNKLDPEILS